MFLIRALHRGYKFFISPLLAWLGGPGAGCRFEPSCSDYMLEAIETHGLAGGGWLGVKRLARCQPWGGQGSDPVPPRAEIRSSKLEARNKRESGKERMMKDMDCACLTHAPRAKADRFRASDFELRASR